MADASKSNAIPQAERLRVRQLPHLATHGSHIPRHRGGLERRQQQDSEIRN